MSQLYCRNCEAPLEFGATLTGRCPTCDRMDQLRALTEVVMALEDAKIVRLFGVPGGQCPYPSDVARALYERGVRMEAAETRVTKRRRSIHPANDD